MNADECRSQFRDIIDRLNNIRLNTDDIGVYDVGEYTPYLDYIRNTITVEDAIINIIKQIDYIIPACDELGE